MSTLAREFRALREAVRFFTRIPLPSANPWDPADLQNAATYFPLVGWLVGGAGAMTWWLALKLWSPGIASGISLVVTLLLTGAFHEDGFADVCDGFGGGTTKTRVLEIMRDSRVGAFGAIGVAMILGLKWLAVASLPLALAPAVIVAAHAVSRGAAGSLLATLSYVQEDGKAKPLATRMNGVRLIVSLAFAVVPMLALPVRFSCALLFVAIARGIMARWFVHRIGGYTGDCLGAAQQVTEVVFYLAVVALSR